MPHRVCDARLTLSQAVKEGDVILLTHSQTRRNLHSHLHKSEITKQQEVSAFGDNGKGDNGDYWIVETQNGKFWEIDGFVRLLHKDTKMYLNCNHSAKVVPRVLTRSTEAQLRASLRSPPFPARPRRPSGRRLKGCFFLCLIINESFIFFIRKNFKNIITVSNEEW